MSFNTQNEVIDEKDAARYICMSESWMRISRCKGHPDTPPFIKIGRSVRYRTSDLDNWLESRLKHNTLGG